MEIISNIPKYNRLLLTRRVLYSSYIHSVTHKPFMYYRIIFFVMITMVIKSVKLTLINIFKGNLYTHFVIGSISYISDTNRERERG